MQLNIIKITKKDCKECRLERYKHLSEDEKQKLTDYRKNIK